MGSSLSKAHSNRAILVSRGSARLSVSGRRLKVQRHTGDGKSAPIAAAMGGMSRRSVNSWVDRHKAEGEPGLLDRSLRPHTTPAKTSAEVEDKVLAAGAEHRDAPTSWHLGRGAGPHDLADPAPTRRALLRECDPYRPGVPVLDPDRGALRTQPVRRAGPLERDGARPESLTAAACVAPAERVPREPRGRRRQGTLAQPLQH
jgi:hypothetical protein